ncbi:lipopolysaccharide biosynthesis protein [Sunxiuqinia indica]|uniref:lipopolysaccharide biosynthesis protein n=1 Tax=Sunxiuqinia indica TaxID=2692584 RepID=UPI00135B2FC6|nr:oligosaccharide flippase family protein [Sunxiuqinia indica]
MGIIIRQSIKGSIWSYLGVLIGFVTTSYLYPNYISTDTVGLFSLLVAYATLFGQFSLLGVHGVTSRMFPHFRDKNKNHQGFLFITLLFLAVGFSIFILAYLFFSPYLIESNTDKSKLFADYIFLLLPLTFFTMIFAFFDTYNKVLYDAVFGTFLQEFFQRFGILVAMLLYIFEVFNIHQLIIAFAIVISSKGIIILIHLFLKDELHFKPNLKFITKELRTEIISVASFSVLGGLGSMIVFNIDKIVINQMLDLSNTGVYTIAFYFGTLVIIPSRPLLKIAGTLIADAWRNDDLLKIKEIYYKSCINQFIIGGFLFLGIWANIENILTILGPAYEQSRWVIFFIGLGYLFDMMTGANAQVIAFSKYYKVSLYFILSLIVVVVALLYFLIPIWGITGAAIAIAVALFLNNLMRFLFLFHRFGLQPFNYKFVAVIVFNTGIYLLLQLIPQQQFILDIFIRGTIITILTAIVVYKAPISEEIQKALQQIVKI